MKFWTEVTFVHIVGNHLALTEVAVYFNSAKFTSLRGDEICYVVTIVIYVSRSTMNGIDTVQ